MLAAPSNSASPLPLCPHCGASCVEPYRPEKQWEYAGEAIKLLHCPACDGQFSHPLPSAALLEQLYGKDYDYSWYRDHYPAKFLDALTRVWQYRKRGLLRGKRILDYGGGLGYFSKALRLFGYEAETRDPVYQRSATGQATAASVAAAGEKWDVVVCHHVLEHAPDPGAFLTGLGTLLAPGGSILIVVPNADSLGYKSYGPDWIWHQGPFIHIHHFTPRGLRTLVEQHGYQITGENYFERWDANTLADVGMTKQFQNWDGSFFTAPKRKRAALRNTARRFGALLLSELLFQGSTVKRPELLYRIEPGPTQPH